MVADHRRGQLADRLKAAGEDPNTGLGACDRVSSRRTRPPKTSLVTGPGLTAASQQAGTGCEWHKGRRPIGPSPGSCGPCAHRRRNCGDLGCGLLLLEHAPGHHEWTVRRPVRILVQVIRGSGSRADGWQPPVFQVRSGRRTAIAITASETADSKLGLPCWCGSARCATKRPTPLRRRFDDQGD